MKIFVLVICLATLVGGFAGGELADRTFSVFWAAITGVGTFAVLMCLGALFHRQEERRKAKSLPPEMRDVFDRMTGKKSYGDKETDRVVREKLLGTMMDLVEQDREQIAAGKVPDRP